MWSRMRSLLLPLLSVAVLWAWWPSTIRAVSHEDQAQLLATELRCPVCQNLSVADSPSEMANQMREVIREKLNSGESADQILAYFVSRYGEWILLSPKREGFNWVAWLLPFVAILGGVGVIGLVVRRSVSRSQPSGGDERSHIDPRYVERLEAELMESER